MWLPVCRVPVQGRTKQNWAQRLCNLCSNWRIGSYSHDAGDILGFPNRLLKFLRYSQWLSLWHSGHLNGFVNHKYHRVVIIGYIKQTLKIEYIYTVQCSNTLNPVPEYYAIFSFETNTLCLFWPDNRNVMPTDIVKCWRQLWWSRELCPGSQHSSSNRWGTQYLISRLDWPASDEAKCTSAELLDK